LVEGYRKERCALALPSHDRVHRELLELNSAFTTRRLGQLEPCPLTKCNHKPSRGWQCPSAATEQFAIKIKETNEYN